MALSKPRLHLPNEFMKIGPNIIALADRCAFPLCISSANPPPHSPSAQAITERADERTNKEETGHHPSECHLGRYLD